MKKYLPLILLGAGILVFVAVYFLIIKAPKKETPEETATLAEVSLSDRPIASLIPTDDGHYLNLTIEKITLPAKSMDYELLYVLPDGRTQGVPGSVDLSGIEKIEKKLLLGSESSGKFRYDEGVNEGTLTLRFRDDKGKLMARFMTKFALLPGALTLSSVDEAFQVKFTKVPKGYFVIMETFGVPEMPSGNVAFGPWGLFYSGTAALSGEVVNSDYSILNWDGSAWTADSFVSGYFVGTSE